MNKLQFFYDQFYFFLNIKIIVDNCKIIGKNKNVSHETINNKNGKKIILIYIVIHNVSRETYILYLKTFYK